MGKLPSNWKLVPWKEVTIKIGDVDHKMPKAVNSGFPYISPRDFKPNNTIDFENSKKISKNDFINLSRKIKPEKGDIIFARYGTIGEIILVDCDIDFLASYSCAVIKHNNEKILPKYSYYFAQSPLINEEIEKHINKSTQPNVGIKGISQFLIPLPPLPEQKRIVSKLDALFERIDKSMALLEENITHTESLMASALDEIFKKLESKSKVYKISDFADIKGGKRLPKGLKVQEEKTDYPYIRVADFQDNGTVDLSSLQYITKEAHKQIKRYIINPEDLYISIAGTIGKTGMIPNELKGANLTENAARFVFKSDFEINNKFIYYFTLSDNFKTQITDATKTVAQPKLALTRLKEVELPIPDIGLQNKAVERFNRLSTNTYEIAQEQQNKLNNLKALKESILDRAFKGGL